MRGDVKLRGRQIGRRGLFRPVTIFPTSSPRVRSWSWVPENCDLSLGYNQWISGIQHTNRCEIPVIRAILVYIIQITMSSINPFYIPKLNFKFLVYL